MEVVGGPPAGSGGGVGSELVVSIAILFNGWTRLLSRSDSEFPLFHAMVIVDLGRKACLSQLFQKELTSL